MAKGDRSKFGEGHDDCYRAFEGDTAWLPSNLVDSKDSSMCLAISINELLMTWALGVNINEPCLMH